MIKLSLSVKDRIIFFGWIAGLILAAMLLWSLTFPFRASLLMRSANRSLIETEDQRRLSVPIHFYSRHFPIGCMYTVRESDSHFFVFTIFRDGILVPCGAEISKEGKVIEIIPLGNHSRQVWDRIPQGLIKLNIRRIETAWQAAARRVK